MRAFIIRPFGTKGDIDFDAVEELLIRPALKRLDSALASGLQIVTGTPAVEGGAVRGDALTAMLVADLVVIDVSLCDANVFYALGIRHALRDKRTLLLSVRSDSRTFDLTTSQYLVYDGADPAASIPKLWGAAYQLMNSDTADSPVYAAFPRLKSHPASDFMAVPAGFTAEVARAQAGRFVPDLELLADEAADLEWGVEGLRAVGRALFALKAFESARVVWEKARDLDLFDLEAQATLATVYERLGELTLSDRSIERALSSAGAPPETRAELQALLGRNAKARWRADWEKAPAEQRRAAALKSPWLDQSLQAYADAFAIDLNHFYSGLNALAMTTVLTQLAEALPEIWAELFDQDEHAERRLSERKEYAAKVSGAVELSVEAARSRLARQGRSDVWVEISRADLYCLISRRPARVANAYRKALSEAPGSLFALDAVRRQLKIYEQLGVAAENVDAALAVLPGAEPAPESDAAPAVESGGETSGRVVLFTGHMIDAPGRDEPRFPPEMEEVAREAIKRALTEELASSAVSLGIAGGASGGDIIFHEVCAELGIPTALYLVISPYEYIRASVSPAGKGWVERFQQLYELERKESRVRVLSEDPSWLDAKLGYNIWQRSNLWMLRNALAGGGERLTLIALWNGVAGDGPGGTADMVEQARARGAKVVILSTRELFGL